MVPEGWRQVPLADLVTFKSGGTPSTQNPDYWGGEIPWISAKDLTSFRLSDSQLKVTMLGVQSGTRLVPEDTVLILVRGMTLYKDVPVGLTTRPMTFNQDVRALIPENGVSPEFLAYSLVASKQRLRQFVDTAGHGTGRLASDFLRELPILLPPAHEQSGITRCLTAWDRAIVQTEQLIKAKRKLKKGLMQQLLTGQRRFPGFGQPAKQGQLPDDWKRVKLGDIAQVIFSNVDKKNHSNETPVWLCNYLDVYSNSYISKHLDFMRATATNAEISKFSLQAEDVIITKDSETPDDIARAATVVEDLRGVICGYHLAILRPHLGVSGFFLGQLLMYSQIRYQFSRIANGATRFGLNLSSVAEVSLWLPSYDEQVKIAKVLMRIDHEIDALLLLSNQLKEQKRGLMQKLLTGQIRVKAAEEMTAS